jgi:lipoprotein-releasing system permease protein
LYKILLCWRYLLTRYLALACIVSVMLGVATLIVVNSVMSGFSTKLKDRLHGLLSDVLIEARTYDGFPDAEGKMARIMKSPAGQYIEAMTPMVEIFAMIQFRVGHETVTRPIRLVGVDAEGRARIGGFAEFLLNPKNRVHPTFRLDEPGTLRYWELHPPIQPIRPVSFSVDPSEPPPPTPPEPREKIPVCAIVGNALASYRDPTHKPGEKPRDLYLLRPGDDIIITTVSSQKLAPVYDRFVVCDYFKSEMSEYDANYVFVPLDYLQHLRTMEGRVTSIEMKLKDFSHAPEVVHELQKMFPPPNFMVQTWMDKQGPLLGAISVERGLLNLLLFMIIGVAGFGILAIFSMIVVEKTRDIGILKALGASNRGVMSIFLGYGLLLGVIGAGLGSALGLTITIYINEIENFLTKATGTELFPRDIYYFDKIPTNIQLSSVLLVNLGAVAIAVLASVLPALRAALLHPVRALRYE